MATTGRRAEGAAVQLVVLDCDGVMFDSREANRAYYTHLRETFGRPPLTEEEVSYVHTHSAPESVPFLFRAWPGDLARVDEYRRRVDYTPFLGRMAMEPDLIEFLRTVRRTMKTAISTNRTSTMDAVLTTFGLRPWFDIVVTASDVAHPKPHPEALHRILAHVGLPASAGIFIGDSRIDLEHAAAVGMPMIAFRNPELPADYHVRSFREVLALPPFHGRGG
jgi:HAD superfamily hydrolase (TIGR01509 family)